MEQALSIVDIVQHILSFIPCQRDLYHACLVNSTWAAAGLVLLWRYPQCHTIYGFQLLLETLRHELHTRGPILVSSIPSSGTTPDNEEDCRSSTAISRSSTTAATRAATAFLVPPTLGRQQSYLLRQSSLAELPQTGREYGIPFQGTRNFYRGEFVRELDLQSLGGMLSHAHVEIIARSPKLGFRSLDFELLPIRFSQDLHRIIAKSRNLRRLRLGPFRTSMDDLRVLRPTLAGLSELHLLHCTDRMRDQELTFILQTARQLSVLEIRGDDFTDESLQWIAYANGPALKQLTLETPRLTDRVLGDIVGSCKGLEALHLERCDQLADLTLTTLIEAYDQLHHPSGYQQHLHVQSSYASFAPSAPTPGSPTSPSSSPSSSLTSVPTTSSPPHSSPSSSSMPDLADMGCYSIHLPPLSTNSKHLESSAWNRQSPLTSLTILRCDHLESALISQLIGLCPALESVVLGGNAITDEAFRSLSQQPFLHLRRLEFHHCPEVTDDVAMSVFFNCDTIADLTIHGSNFTRSTFDAIAACLWPCLERLHLEQVRLVLNSSVEAILTNCKRLQSLRLWNCRYLTLDLFTDEMAYPCPDLEELEFMDKYARPAPNMHIQEQGEHQPGAGDNPQDSLEQTLQRLGLLDSNRRGSDPTKYDSCSLKFLECLVTRFENLRILRLAKLTESPVQPNIMSYLTQLDRLERFTIIRNPGITVDNIKDLARHLPSLVEFGCALNTVAQQTEANVHNATCRQPRIRAFNAMFDTREEFRLSMD